jgi:hypothetical protein
MTPQGQVKVMEMDLGKGAITEIRTPLSAAPETGRCKN